MEPATHPVLSYHSPRPRPRPGPLTLLLLCVLALSLIAAIVSAIGDILYIQLWHEYLAGAAISPSQITLSEDLRSITKIAMPIGLASAFALLLLWTYVSHSNLRRLSNGRVRYSPWTVIVDWFLPRWCCIRPYEAMKFLFSCSTRGDPRAFAPLVGTWWASWLVGWFLMLAATFAQRHRESETTDAQFSIDWATWNIVPIPAFVISGLLLMIIVYKVDRAQKRRQLAGKP